jgi:phenylacetate-CoA ligase
MADKDATESIYWEEELETLPRQELEQLQLKRLRETVTRAQAVPFYRELFKKASVEPERIGSLAAIRNLPFTQKEDLRKRWPYGMLAVAPQACVRAHSSSGTTGQAVAVLHTKNDLATWSNLVARCLYGVGVRKSDVFQNMAGYGLFTGGLGFHYGGEKLGVLMLPASTGNSQRQIRLMLDFGTTLVHFMPSYGIYLLNVFKEMGIDPRKDTNLKFAVLGAENYTEETRQRIERSYGIQAFDSYGLSEMNGPGVSFECHLKDGLHVWEDCYILEILDPDGDEPVADGEIGEIVFTTLAKEAMPLIRYRTRDLAALIPEPCACGRTHRRLSSIKGRVDDLIIFKGVNMYPSQIEKVIMSFPEVGPIYMIHLETRNDRDYMTVQVEVAPQVLEGEPQHVANLKGRIVDALQSDILVRPGVQLDPIGTIPVPEVGKAKRVIDKRTL